MKTTQTSSHIAVLDGLRFLAALCVMTAHYAQWILTEGDNQWILSILTPLSGLGMALFFTLSGFVIHYNYSQSIAHTGGIRKFVIARFSRLYPLFITLFATDIALALYFQHYACVNNAGNSPYDFLRALPFYLTLTQSWMFGIVCGNGLIYQFLQVSAVSWSISVELFLYMAYIFIGPCLSSLSANKQLFSAAIFHAAIVGYFLLCYHHTPEIDQFAQSVFGEAATTAHGYQDSLLRWLYYFNPFSQMSGFIAGIVAANLYMSKGASTEKNTALVVLSIIAAIGTHFWFYNILAPHDGFIGRTASTLYMPLVAVMIYALARSASSLPARIIGNRVWVKLGEASYSIYLLHAFLSLIWIKLTRLAPTHQWLLYIVAMLCVLVASRICYLCYEKPAMRWLRKRLSPP